VFLANKTPPKFILFVVPADKLILVPIILLGPIDDKTLALPTLKSTLNYLRCCFITSRNPKEI
jgi:hypothetical protein